MRQATVAIEDRRFYKHGGVDFEGVVRAAIKNISSGKTVEGGSTLTMQLVRNLYTDDRARSGVAGYKRKVREAKLASELEDRHPGRSGKDWVLNQYLNNVPYGTVGGQTGRRRRGGLAHLLRQARAPADARRGGAARRPAAGAVAATTRSSTRRPRSTAATRSCARWPRRATSRRTPPTRAQRETLGGQEEPLLRQAPRELLLRLRQAAADRRVRRRRACARAG